MVFIREVAHHSCSLTSSGFNNMLIARLENALLTLFTFSRFVLTGHSNMIGGKRLSVQKQS